MRSQLLLFALILSSPVALAQTREEIVRGDKEKVEKAGFWMYNDIPGALEKAKQTGKPIVVVLRCLPCHECVKLDDELVDTDPVIRPLLEQFVCVRQVSTNGLDLETFQYDTDQSFAVFFMNADKTIYGRFGTRSHRTEWVGDVSLKGLANALQGALDLHRNFDEVKDSLAGKRGRPMEVTSPELYPSLKDKFTAQLDYEGDVVKSCIHCHQIGDAQREFYWLANKPIPDHVLWPYPHPKLIGLIMDSRERATIKKVTKGSYAEAAGLRAGDMIEKLDGQPMLSIADVQWVLHHADPNGASVKVEAMRDGNPVNTALDLPADWRKAGDLSWRVTTWGLRRMAAGGMILETLDAPEGEGGDTKSSQMALRVKGAGKYGPHGAARRAGFRQGDVITVFDNQRGFKTEQDLLTYVVQNKRAGDKVDVQLRRGGKEMRLQLLIQK